MNIGFEMFLLAAEEMNFSRAAERAFVTQQCLSDHIKRLEETYHVTLFKRRPHLELTPEGQAMRRYLEKIQFLENSMKNELDDIKSGLSGTIIFGISNTRGSIMIPEFIPSFQKDFPKINIEVILNDTRELEKLLLQRKLDMFIGVNTSPHVLFLTTPIAKERIFLVVSRPTIEKYCPTAEAKLMLWKTKGVDLNEFSHIPFVCSYSTSTTTFTVQQYLMRNHIRLNTPINVSDFNILMELCHKGGYATFAPIGHISPILQMNEGLPEEKQLMCFPITGMNQRMSLDLIRHREAQSLSFMDEFAVRLISHLKAQNDWIERRLSTS